VAITVPGRLPIHLESDEEDWMGEQAAVSNENRWLRPRDPVPFSALSNEANDFQFLSEGVFGGDADPLIFATLTLSVSILITAR